MKLILPILRSSNKERHRLLSDVPTLRFDTPQNWASPSQATRNPISNNPCKTRIITGNKR